MKQIGICFCVFLVIHSIQKKIIFVIHLRQTSLMIALDDDNFYDDIS